MAQYMHRVNEIAAAEGISTNPLEEAALCILQSEVENLEAANEAKEQVLRVLQDRLEVAKAELRAEKQISNNFQQVIMDDLEKMTEKNSVLTHYVESIEAGEEFRLNILAKEAQAVVACCFNSGKQIIEKARALNAETMQLRELQRKCDELKSKASDPETQE